MERDTQTKVSWKSLILSPNFILTYLSDDEMLIASQSILKVHGMLLALRDTVSSEKEFLKEKEVIIAENTITVRKYNLRYDQICSFGKLSTVTNDIGQYLNGGKSAKVTKPNGEPYTTYDKPIVWWWDYAHNNPQCATAKKSWATVVHISYPHKFGIIWKR